MGPREIGRIAAVVVLAVLMSLFLSAWCWLPVIIATIGAIGSWLVLRRGKVRAPSTERPSIRHRSVMTWVGWILVVAGSVTTWLGGTGSYPGVDPAGANSTTLTVVFTGIVLFLAGIALVLTSLLRRSYG